MSEARNGGRKEAIWDWTLVLDPDELPSFHMLALLSTVSSMRLEAAGILFWTKNYWGGELGAERESDWHLRLFRTGRGSFYRPVHELVAIDGKPETQTRGTQIVVRARKNDYLIHSKPGDRLKVDADYYERLGGEGQ